MKRVENKQPLVSVVMPLYNCEKYVQEAVFGVQRQTCQNWELIVVDDGSSDNSYELVKQIARKDKRIRLYRNRNNMGIGKTMNRLLKLARGVYVARMDSDDVMLATRLTTQVEFLQKNPQVGILGAYLAEMNKSRLLTSVRKVPVAHEEIVSGLLTRQTIQNPTLMMRVSSIPKNELYFDGALSPVDDLEFYLRMVRNGVVFANIPKYLMYYRAHGDNSSLSNIKRSYALTKRVRDQALKQNMVKPSVLQRVTSFFQSVIVGLLPNNILYSVYKIWQGSGVRGEKIGVMGQRREYGMSLVMPIYRGESLIKKSIERIVFAMRSTARPFELIVVVDGMFDKTKVIAEKMQKQYPELKVLSYPNNKGKGCAVRYGMSKAIMEYVGYIDAGHDIDTSSLIDMVEAVNDDEDNAVFVADKTHPMSQIIKVPLTRKVLSGGFRLIVSMLYGKKMGDTQVGLKIFRKDEIWEWIVDDNLIIDRFAFDVELMQRLIARKKKIVRVPVVIRKNGELSTVKVGDVWEMMVDLIRLRLHNFAIARDVMLSCSSKLVLGVK